MTNTAEITTMLATMASKIAKSRIREFDADERFLRFALMGARAKMLIKEELQEEFERRSYKQLVMPWCDIDEETEVEITPLDDGVKVIEIKLCVEKEDKEEESDELKPYVWHPREKFDGNPKGYGVLEAGRDGELCGATVKPFNSLFDYTTHFMYIEPLEVEND